MNYSTCLTRKHTLSLAQTLCALLLFSVANAADFGVAHWGMSMDEVKNLESRSNVTPFGEMNYLIFKVDLAGIEQTRIVYQFQNDRLVEGRFLFRPTSMMDVRAAVRHYQTIKTMISNQYGPPNTDQVLTASNDGMMDIAPESYANELASDRLILKSSWSAPTAMLKHQLAWNASKPHHQLHYMPIGSMMGTQDTDAF